MKKQSITFLLIVLMSTMGAHTFAHDIEVVNADGATIYYNYINNNTELAVSSRSGYYSNEYNGNVVIPESVTYNGTTYSVTSIGYEAFKDCSGLTSITIPNSVTRIGSCAFLNCITEGRFFCYRAVITKEPSPCMFRSPKCESITEDRIESNLSKTKNIPPKAVIFSDFCCTFAMPLMIFACLDLQH